MPSVAGVLITYNHEAFIAQSIESVRAGYDGLIHLVVSDDCSTNRTQQVIAPTVSRAGANIIVHPAFRTSNVGGPKNFSDAWASPLLAANISHCARGCLPDRSDEAAQAGWRSLTGTQKRRCASIPCR